jgi:hypothetical protein
MSAFKHSAVSFGTSDTPPPEAGRNIGPISLHNAIANSDVHNEESYGVLNSL